MSAMINAAAGVAALESALMRSRARESQQHRLAQQEANIECAVQPEAMSRHKGDCGR
ncbi:hypothetical protein [Paraburkholderia domus]|uniref:Uncharacterized protein n=1 Tax=Paraburkholderia domus TaxID=2793075 RepID=A0A9N8QYV5_9BURK|nr:hypothetical protein [Paraburkholderia domus]MBK5061083.1 hypothetical protein [Burkholderia sp. R-70199]MBK5121189.1 hypothetical protein [Burkholderia sp. R-69980]MBK5166278.1 hypothetical protein [Burkholderia sp. R-70211]MBK5179493.1 hypothetical protein [Burkholderia sp. R-69749]MCI0146432.1 hypothetical protein [Paraburkholderia sediminicola]